LTSVDAWGSERTKYNWDSPGFSEATGHFTQVVWKASKSVGCAVTACDGKGSPSSPGMYVTCEYYPVGNMDVIGAATDSYTTNVGKLVAGKMADTVVSH